MRLSLCLLACAAAPALSACVMLNGESAKAPDQIVADAQAAVRAVQSYHVSLDVRAGRDDATFDLDVAGPGLVSGHMNIGGSSGDIVVASDQVYLRGADLVATLAGSPASPVSGGWVETSGSAVPDVVKAVTPFIDPTTVADCVLGQHGSLTATRGTYAGESVVELHDAGDVPGTAPATLAVAATGRPYPLHLVVTGPTQLGTVALPDACDAGPAAATATASATSSAQTVDATFDSWGDPMTVTPPTGAVASAPFGSA
ncbi:MAG TPA: hypothetical protein VFO60_04580 [Candidatus Dormibacteraeota bacterium]|nr:hypothetical protein [Candidatus Dormibacteraeota bacterium]